MKPALIITRKDLDDQAELLGLEVVAAEPHGNTIHVVVRSRKSDVVIFRPVTSRVEALRELLRDPARIPIATAYFVELDERADYRSPGNGG